jgi:hypothetical protein
VYRNGTLVYLSDYYDTYGQPNEFRLFRRVAIRTSKHKFYGWYNRSAPNPVVGSQSNKLDYSRRTRVWIPIARGRPLRFYLSLSAWERHYGGSIPIGGGNHTIVIRALWH